MRRRGSANGCDMPSMREVGYEVGHREDRRSSEMRRSELRSNGDNVPSSLARTNPRFPGPLLLSVQGNREGKHGGGTAGETRGPHDDAALHAPESGGDGRRDPRLAVTPCLDLRSLRDGENGEGGGNGPPITTEERRNGGERHGRDHDEGRRGAHRGRRVPVRCCRLSAGARANRRRH